MKFLLAAVNAKYIHSNLGIYSLKACADARMAGEPVEIELAEYTINHQPEQVLQDIYRRRPEAVGFSCYIWNISFIRELIADLALVLPQTEIWLGGPEVSFECERLLHSLPAVRGVMKGEGEETFCGLAAAYGEAERLGASLQAESGIPGPSDADLAAIPNLAFRRRDGGIFQTPDGPPSDMGSFPFSYKQLGLENLEHRIIYYESSRGCPFSCSYCLSSVDKALRFRSISLVKQELDWFLERKVPQVKFVDRTFNCKKSHALAIWRHIQEHDNGVTNFHFEIAADLLDEEEMELLEKMRPGLVQLEIGVQSTNPQTLREIRRRTDIGEIRRITARINSWHNIHQHLDLIAGLPWEGIESFRTSFNEVYGMEPEQLQLGFLKVLKGSYMHEKASEYEIHYTDKPPYEVLFTKWLPYDQVLKLKKVEEMVELYYNSGQFVHTLPVLEKAFSDPFCLYERLAEYYEEKGYFINNPARGYRYQVLMDFAVSAEPEKEELYRQLLTLDMYLRENMKSRPAFALTLLENQEIKEKINDFYRREEKNPTYLTEYVQDGYTSRQMARMTQIECFTLPVWEKEPLEHNNETAIYYLLFDYRKRNPLNQEAYTILLPLI